MVLSVLKPQQEKIQGTKSDVREAQNTAPQNSYVVLIQMQKGTHIAMTCVAGARSAV